MAPIPNSRKLSNFRGFQASVSSCTILAPYSKKKEMLMKLCKWVAPIALIVALFLTPLARGQVLQQVPSDALVVVKFNKLKATSDKVAALSQKFGLAGINPELADPIGTMRQKAK